jgi:hypothetical protein
MTETIADYHTLIYRAKSEGVKGYSGKNKTELVAYLNSKNVCTTKTCKVKRRRKEGTPNTAYQNFISNELKNNNKNIPSSEKMRQAAAKWNTHKKSNNTTNGKYQTFMKDELKNLPPKKRMIKGAKEWNNEPEPDVDYQEFMKDELKTYPPQVKMVRGARKWNKLT